MSVSCLELSNGSSRDGFSNDSLSPIVPGPIVPEKQTPDTGGALPEFGNGISPDESGAVVEQSRNLQIFFPGLEIQPNSECFRLKYPGVLSVVDELQCRCLQSLIDGIQPGRLVIDCPVRLDAVDLNGRGQVHFAGELVIGAQAGVVGCAFRGQETMISGNVRNCSFAGKQTHVTARAEVINSCFAGDQISVAGKITSCTLTSQRIEISGAAEHCIANNHSGVVYVGFDAKVSNCCLWSRQIIVFGQAEMRQCECSGEVVVSGAAAVDLSLVGGDARLVVDGKGEYGPLRRAEIRIWNLGTVTTEYTFGTAMQPTRVQLVLWCDGRVPPGTVNELDRLVQQGLVQRRVVDRLGRVLTTAAECW